MVKQTIYNILKGKFLISDNAFKNWGFIIFISLLAIIMIASSHSADKKVHEIAEKNSEIKELRSEFVDIRSRLMQTKMESKIVQMMRDKGLNVSTTPPRKILIKSNN